jgi:hypothetical protein
MDHRTDTAEPVLFAVPQGAARERIAGLQADARRGRSARGRTGGHGWRHALGTRLLRVGAALVAEDAGRLDTGRGGRTTLRASG